MCTVFAPPPAQTVLHVGVQALACGWKSLGLSFQQLQMLGYDISWAAFNIVEVMSASKFTFKVRRMSLPLDPNLVLTGGGHALAGGRALQKQSVGREPWPLRRHLGICHLLY